MISNFTIVTIPQYLIFAAVTVLIYGWVEEKKPFGIIGSGLLVLLGIYALITIVAGWLGPVENADTILGPDGEKLFLPDELPVEGRLLPFYYGLVLNGIIAVAAMLGEIYNKRFALILKIITGTFSILLFFLMMGAIKG